MALHRIAVSVGRPLFTSTSGSTPCHAHPLATQWPDADPPFQVIRRLMMSSDQSSGSNRFTRLLQHHQRELERSEVKKVSPPPTSATISETPMVRGVVGGNLDRLVRGTIACDSLVTLASHLLELEPALVRRARCSFVAHARAQAACRMHARTIPRTSCLHVQGSLVSQRYICSIAYTASHPWMLPRLGLSSCCGRMMTGVDVCRRIQHAAQHVV